MTDWASRESSEMRFSRLLTKLSVSLAAIHTLSEDLNDLARDQSEVSSAARGKADEAHVLFETLA